ncbi:MAG: GNAT family N-acetyltransferase [Mycoplasmataceae bacterium]|jgi:predicted acetyltransferase|nr:GNAT family N-acetyltransferase [Mycoplasmataceae bacterium]
MIKLVMFQTELFEIYGNELKKGAESLKNDDVAFYSAMTEELISLSNDIKKYIQLKTDARDPNKLMKGYVAANYYFIVNSENNSVVGLCNIRLSLDAPNLKNYGGHIGYLIFKQYRGHGYASTACLLSIEECKKLNINPIMISCFENNLASKKIIEKNGFIFSHTYPYKDEYVSGNMLIYYLNY